MMPRKTRWDMIASSDRLESTPPTLKKEPIENTLPNEPMDPIENAEPIEPMDMKELCEAIEYRELFSRFFIGLPSV